MQQQVIKHIAIGIGVLLAHAGLSQSILPEEYLYDVSGNMTSDVNKDIVGIHYNMLNLPDTIMYSDGRKIVYVYTAEGQKIRQQVIPTGSAPVTRRDYVGSLLYENNALQQVQHEEGRIIVHQGQPEYQYHLKDHLGNVRTTVTAAPETTEYLATMESEKAGQEQSLFSDLTMRSPYTRANHTAGGNEVLNVAPGVARTAAFNLAVTKGDVIYLEVYAYYENGVISDDEPGDPALQSTLASVVTAAGAVGGKLFSDGAAGLISSSGSPALMLLAWPDAGGEQVPVAHLNYSLFDKNYVMATGGYKKLTQQGAYAKELLTLGPIKIEQSGYLDVYLSNASAKHRVYFDDLKVTHVAGPVVQEDGYDPFGMTLTNQHDVRYGEPENRYLYNGKELQNDFGLSWYDYGARMYDAALGRWHVHDPLAEKYASWSPYQYVMNNPLKFVDPDGAETVFHADKSLKPELQKNAERAVKHARSIKTGAKVLANAENNPNVVVHVVFSAHLGYDGTNKLLGLTRKRETGDMRRNGDRVLLNLPESSSFHGLDGIDITKDFMDGKKIYLVVVVATGDSYKVAEAILHEIQAHVNGDLAGKIPPIAGPYRTEEQREHDAYGAEAAATYPFGANKKGKPNVVPGGQVADPGTIAEQVQRELARLKLTERRRR